MSTIETDYQVIGAGACGMAFTDALIEESDADVVMVDCRHRPGGHWNDAYPFVRLHMPSAIYGINSRQLGNDTIEQIGPNAGYYKAATAAKICDYYQRALEDQFLPSGQVRFFGLHDYTGEDAGAHRIIRPRPARPIFEPDRIRIQPVRTGFPHFNAALIGYIEATRGDDADKNRLCPPNPYPNHAYDWISNTCVSMLARVEWSREPDIEAWLEDSRLNIERGAANHMEDPKMQEAVIRLTENTESALINLKRLMAEAQAGAPANA